MYNGSMCSLKVCCLLGLSFTTYCFAQPVVAVSPSSGLGLVQEFAMDVANADIEGVERIYFNINYAQSNQHTCQLDWMPQIGLLGMFDDTASSWAGALRTGQAGIMSNTQCTVSNPRLDQSDEFTTRLIFTVSFSTGYSGPKTLWTVRLKPGVPDTGWQKVGSWEVPRTNVQQPSVSLTPSFSFTREEDLNLVIDRAVALDAMSRVSVLFNDAPTRLKMCQLEWLPAQEKIGLYSDDGTMMTTYLAAGAENYVRNSQCMIRDMSVNYDEDAEVYRASVTVSFLAGFDGTKAVWVTSYRNSGERLDWQWAGSWDVPKAVEASRLSYGGITSPPNGHVFALGDTGSVVIPRKSTSERNTKTVVWKWSLSYRLFGDRVTLRSSKPGQYVVANPNQDVNMRVERQGGQLKIAAIQQGLYGFADMRTVYIQGGGNPTAATILLFAQQLFDAQTTVAKTANRNILFGVCACESTLLQFRQLEHKKYRVTAWWPHDNGMLPGGGKGTRVGLTQITATTMEEAFDWQANMQSGAVKMWGPKQSYATAAKRMENSRSTRPKLPTLSAEQLDQNALSVWRYGSLERQYWVPNAAGTAWIKNPKSGCTIEYVDGVYSAIANNGVCPKLTNSCL